MSTLSELQNYLVSLSHGSLGASGVQWGIYRLQIPADAHDDAILLNPTGGLNSIKTFGGRSFEQPRVQIMVRSKNADTAYLKAEAIWKSLDGTGRINMGSTVWHYIEALGKVEAIGPDGNDRRRFSLNFQIIKKESA